jgi:(4-alkanoyl-5-oxo-2,5-dihydrofuran-3-yl)methyl phosphate reductase
MILITGATGNVGSELVKQLFAKGESLRVVTRDESKVAHLDPNIERFVGEISSEATADRALDGVNRIFMFPLIIEQNNQSNNLLLSRAKKAGVKQVVMLSSLGAEMGTSKIGELHKEKEQLVEKSGIAWTFIRPGAFMSNAFRWEPTIKAQGKVFSPTGNGKVAPISPRDIATALAVALTSAGHEGKIYLLTGPELLSAPEQVAILSRAIGKSIQCVDVPVSAATEQFSKTGAPWFLVDGLRQLWEGIKEGKSEVQTKDLEYLTSSKGESFESWCIQHRDKFLS